MSKNFLSSTDKAVEYSKDTPKETYVTLNGVAGDVIGEYNYKFFKLQNEVVVQNKNAFIVLGRDRAGSPTNGYGGKANTDCDSIDIVVGRLSCISDSADLKEKASWANPDFINDACRIHISQKTDIDTNFKLPKGKVGFSTEVSKSGTKIVRSGIGIKSDSIRIIARSGIKLVSSADDINSFGLSDQEKKGIDLIAGVPYDPQDKILNKRYNLKRYIHDMQPIPKGDNLEKALIDIGRQLDALSGVIMKFITLQMRFNNEISTHTHFETFQGSPTLPSHVLPGPTLNMNMDIFEKTVNDLLNFKSEYLPYFQLEFLTKGRGKYINSMFHHLN